MEQFYWAALGVAKGIETAQLVGLVDFFGSARAVWEATKEELMTTGLLSQDQSRKFWESCRQNTALPERLAERFHSLQHLLIFLPEGFTTRSVNRLPILIKMLRYVLLTPV